MFKVIWDDCTPTKDRRPTTASDVRNDIHIKTVNTDKELLSLLFDITGYDYDDFNLDGEPLEICEKLVGFFDDPGDGSTDFLYISQDGVPFNWEGIFSDYDAFEGIDLETISEKDLQDKLIAAYDEDDALEDDEEDDKFKNGNNKDLLAFGYLIYNEFKDYLANETPLSKHPFYVNILKENHEPSIISFRFFNPKRDYEAKHPELAAKIDKFIKEHEKEFPRKNFEYGSLEDYFGYHITFFKKR